MTNIHTDHQVLASASRTADGTADFTCRAAAVALFLDCTAASGTSPTLDIDVLAVDPVSGQTYTLKSFTQLITSGKELLFIGLDADSVLPTWQMRVSWTLGGTATPTFTFSIGAQPVGRISRAIAPGF